MQTIYYFTKTAECIALPFGSGCAGMLIPTPIILIDIQQWGDFFLFKLF